MDTLNLARATEPTAEIASLLQAHFDLMRATSPEESCHVMAPAQVFADATVVITAHNEDQLLGIGAFKSLDSDHAELKSMHTTAAARGQGVGAAILVELIKRADNMGFSRLSLETGSMAEFAAARALYTRFGFAECPPFGSYTIDPHSTFMTKTTSGKPT